MRCVCDQNVKLLLQSLDMSKVVFWVGAGIDHDSPTSLPLGNDLTKFFISSVWEDVDGKNQAQFHISEIFRKTGDILRSSLDDIALANFPRLETVTEEISELEDALSKKESYSWLRGLECFADAPPNEYHFYLADCIYYGANVVTVNYDVCIPTAYEQLYGRQQALLLQEREAETPGVYTYAAPGENRGLLYYIHGIASDIQNIGVTLKRIKNSLPSSFAKNVKRWFEDDYTFVFLGYGGVDSYDVNPFFLENRDMGKTGIYMRFLGGPGDEDPALRYSENVLLSPFKEKILAVSNSSLLIKQIVVEKKILHDDITKLEKFHWEEQFRRKVRTCPEFNRLARIGIARAIGINYREIGGERIPRWPTEREQKICTTTYIAYRYFDMLRSVGRKGQARKAAVLAGVTEEITLNIRNGKLDRQDGQLKFSGNRDFVKEISEVVEKGGVITWEIITPLKCLAYQNFYDLFIPFRNTGKQKEKNQKAVNGLLQAIELVNGAGTDYYCEVKELYLLYRCKALILAGYFDDFDNAMACLKESLKGYADLGELNGLAAVYLEKAYISILRYKKYKDVNDREQIFNSIKISCKMVRLTKDRHNLERNIRGIFFGLLMASSL